MEAMAVGLPIIATDVSGNRDLVKSGENGCLVPLDDVEQTAIAIKRLIDSENLRRSMGEKSKELVKQYDLQNIIFQMEDIYDYIHRIDKADIPSPRRNPLSCYKSKLFLLLVWRHC